MELSFSTSEMRDVCELRASAIEMVGREAALELEQRLADAEAVGCAGDLVALHPDNTVERSAHELALHFSTGHALVYRSGHVRTPTTPQGATDWVRVTRIRIETIEVPHG